MIKLWNTSAALCKVLSLALEEAVLERYEAPTREVPNFIVPPMPLPHICKPERLKHCSFSAMSTYPKDEHRKQTSAEAGLLSRAHLLSAAGVSADRLSCRCTGV